MAIKSRTAPFWVELSSNTVYFDRFDAEREILTATGVLVQEWSDPSTDLSLCLSNWSTTAPAILK